MSTKILENLKYTDDHEWIKNEGEQASIGVTDFAQSSMGDIVFVELPEVGAIIEKGSAFGVIESVKSVSDLYAPISGEVLEINEALSDAPELVNSAPYDSWIVKVKLSSPEELEALMDSAAYTEHCKE